MVGKRIPALGILNLNLENVSVNSTSTSSSGREVFTRNTSRTDIFFEDFDSSDEVPEGWETAGIVGIDAGYGLNGSNCIFLLTFPLFGLDAAGLTTPAIETIPSNAFFEFNYRIWDDDIVSYTTNIGALTIDVIVNGQIIYTINDANHLTDDYVPLVFSLDNYTGQTIQIQLFMTDYVHGYLTELDNFRVYVEDTYPPQNVYATIEASNVVITWEAPEERALTGYRVYRALEEILDDEDDWVILATDIQELTYIDIEWSDLEYGSYRYIIRSIYTGDILSVPAFSNIVFNVNDIDTPIIPIVTSLKTNYPNPFNPSTTIVFDKATNGLVTIEIFNVKGQKVSSLVNNHFEVGQHRVTWNGIDDNGNQVGSGIYLYQMKTEEHTAIRKMILMK